KTVGRAGDVRLDPAAVLPAVARQIAGSLGFLSADVQTLLLAAGHRRGDPGLCRRSADQLVADSARSGGGGLLFSSFPGDPADRLGVRNARPAAEFDQ